jgi:methylmalonyl-CoA mutase cobalamin-binding domain/chain
LVSPQPPRILLAKVGLDGHDRGIKVVARALRDAGMEVIYTGLWQTPESVVRAARDEDADVVGVSMLSAAHMTLVLPILEALRDDGGAPIPLIVGGIVPEDDTKFLLDKGVAAVFPPESLLAEMTAGVAKIAQAHRKRTAGTARDKPHDWRLALSQELSAAEQGEPEPVRSDHRALWVGVTGAPGVGKSTLINRLAAELRTRKLRVGVLAVDPSSPVTGGALLGDRARMQESAQDPDLFVRSVATRDQPGVLSKAVPAMLRCLDEKDFDVEIVETVGAGQADFEICRMTDVSLLLLMPGAGDELQLEKAGVIELADIIVINKADRPDADTLLTQCREALGPDRDVVKVAAIRNESVTELAELILSKREQPI